ncbi:hypothetical protein HW555_009072 [Spodoptera exigua]|uniref:C2H2-type domain-containing protein n=1 Tax=Spodoptera exigua TaxID=7107 RepID=A0A835GD23_SPOEX|nr:hypothetical protein HW555_009072 [Spodoptera exigua]
MARYSVESVQPPQYDELSPRACDYCRFRAQGLTQYKEHLVTAHSALLFHCEECDKYISRKDFILHMSLHAVQYTSGQDKTVKRKKIRKKEVDDDRSPCELRKSGEDLDTVSERINNSENSNQENEFSDHSDMDYEFGPLPESVFEAIEDSQESQLLENDENHTADNGRVSDESNKTIRLTIESNTISNTITSTEMNSINSCALTIEHNSTLSVTVSSNTIERDTTANEDSSNSNSGAKTPTSSARLGEQGDNSKKQLQHKKTRKCPICSKVYTASSSYFYHMKYFHKGSREHECEVCGKKLTTKSSLTQHLAIHKGQYDLQCKVCDKKFKFKASLYIHEQIHNGKKVWSCNQCHRSFRWRTHLTRHMKRHSSEKNHVCATCGRGFNIRCDLLRHARTHTVGNFSCDKCGQKFAQLRYLKVHIARQHSINIVKESL